MAETNTRENPNRAVQRRRVNQERRELYVETIRRSKRWTLTQVQQDTVDDRLQEFAKGTGNFIAERTRIMQFTTRYKCDTWNHIVQSGVYMHLVKGLLPPPEYSAFEKLCDFMVDMYSATSDHSSTMAGEQKRAECTKARELKSIEILCELERVLPCTRFVPTTHNIMHFARSIHRWNGVRNYWAFPMER